ncbi:glycosyltransferase family 87 protein [Jiangella muralis]|uniref:glycosyltransferase family 87 protein n=1 Tax=Jiangella muralis TaxID=702383 RepID=UPI00069F5283|nr:glycosyltransferase 87 family protein [Jiangella muralis]
MSVTPQRRAAAAAPSRDDPVVAGLSEAIGGPFGRRAAQPRRWWGPVRVALLIAVVVLALGLLADQPCRATGWADRADRSMWTSLCYSDVAFLYRERGFADGLLAYRDSLLEYPVLTGAVMQVTAIVAGALYDAFGGGGELAPDFAESVVFFDLTAGLMALCALGVVVATARTVSRRPWDGLLVAASPLLLLSAYINWDLLAVLATSLAILAWTRDRPVLAGVLIGLGTATKLYPVLLLGVLVLVALRSPERRAALRDAALAAVAAVVAWCAVNLPVEWWAPEGWRQFFTFNADRAADYGSTWVAIGLLKPGLLPESVDDLVVVSAAVLLVLIAALALTAPSPPRVTQLAFLAVAAFLLVNKVWSPQYSLWLLPLAVLARPRVRDLAIWQLAEVVYFVLLWRYLATLYDPSAPLLTNDQYALAVLLRIAGLLWLVGMVVRDIRRPEEDPVRPFLTPRDAVAPRHRHRRREETP